MTVAIAHQTHLWKSPIGHRGLVWAAFGAPPYEVAAGMVRLEAAAVDGRQLQAFAEDFRLGGRDQRLIQEAVRAFFLEVGRRLSARW